MFSARTLVTLVVAGTGLVTAAWLPTRHDSADASDRVRGNHGSRSDRSDRARMPVGELTWRDEFDAPAGAPADPTRWKLETGGDGWGEHQLQYFTGGTDNVAHDGDGHLVITARRERSSALQCYYGPCLYTSARLATAGMFAQRYGRMETRLRAPMGRGLWPAFWMLGDDIDGVGWPGAGEIDVMESVGQQPDRVHGAAEGPGYSGPKAQSRGTSVDVPLARAFHTYAVDWSPELLVWYVDGVEYHRVTPDSLRGDEWVFDHPFSLLLSLAVGGDWPGAPNARTRFPQRMVVDYVRVWAYDPDGTTAPTAAPSNPAPTSAAPVPTSAPATSTPATSTPATSAPATSTPATSAPATTAPPTSAPATTAPPSKAPPATTAPTTAPPAVEKWAPYKTYVSGQKVSYRSVTYKVVESHTSLPGWEPPAVPALFDPV